MSLTIGSQAPLGRPTGGHLNFELPETPKHLLFLHALDREIRGELGDTTIVETRAASMLHETALLPRWYFPPDAVRTDLLEPSETVTHCPFKGDARYWHLRVGDRFVEDAFWEYPDPLPSAPDGLAGLLSPYQEKLDRWFEEDEQVIGHPRDPFHRVDARASRRHVTVRAKDQVVAQTDHPVGVFESGLPPRWYVPREDVELSRLARSETTTICPYKGIASYWSVLDIEDGAWSYEDPLLEAIPARGMLSFDGEGIEVRVE